MLPLKFPWQLAGLHRNWTDTCPASILHNKAFRYFPSFGVIQATLGV